MAYFLLAFFVGSVTVVGPGRRVFTELLADHFFRHADRDVLFAVIDGKSQANELR